MYTPDVWVVLDMDYEGEVISKVLAGWSGGYLDGDSWQLNSGITEITEDEDYFYFHGYSGSVYKCYKKSQRFNNMTAQIYNRLKDKHGGVVRLVENFTL